MSKYAIGIDYGTLSVRALLVDIETGKEVAASIYEYPHGVMEEHIPSGKKLPVGWALQDPQDYLEGLLVTVRDVNLASYEELAEELVGLDGQVVLVGDGVDVAGDVLKEQLGDKCILAPAHIKTQRAGSVALLAKQMADNGEYTDADELKPDYLRPSQAEREKAQHES